MVVSYPTMPDDIKHAEAVLMGSLLLHPEEGTPVQAIQRQEQPKFVAPVMPWWAVSLVYKQSISCVL